MTLCDAIDGSPPGSPVPGILQARTLEWVAISFSKAWKWKVKVKSLSHVRLLVTPWTAAYNAPPSMGFSRQEYWSGLPLPSPIKSLKARPLIPDGYHIADVQYLLNELSCLEISTFVSLPRCGFWKCYHVWALVCGVGDGQGGLGCCDSWGRKESGTTEQLNWIDSVYLTFG